MNTQDRPFKNEFAEFIDGKLDELRKLFEEKNEQYEGAGNPLANFAAGAALAYSNFGLPPAPAYHAMYEEAKAYQRKHIAFINTHDICAPKAEESLKDIAVYCLIEMYMIKKWKDEMSRLALKNREGTSK